MQDYEAEARRKQEEQESQSYQRQRDPFQYGQQVARRRYSEIMSGLKERQTQSSQAYSDLYQQARERAVSQRAAGAPSLSGGMQAQYSDLVSTREMRELGQIGAGSEQAAREIDLQRQSAFANAELEGQQATQMQIQNQQTQLQVVQQRNQILADENATPEQKAEQLRILGYNEEADQLLADPEQSGGNKLFTGALALGGATIGTIGLVGGAKAGAGLLASVGGFLGAAAPFAIGAGLLALAVWGVDELLEASGVNEGEGIGFI